MKPKIVIVGCGVVGAMVAYELSQTTSAEIVVLDKQPPAQGSTGAALGVLMGVISHKVKGRTWRLRETSVKRYGTLIKELAQQGENVPFNSQGIVSLCFDEKKLPRWETLKEKRRSQGWPLEIWTPDILQARCPQIALDSVDENDDIRTVKAAIYSQADGQVHPAALTHSLISVAQSRGVAVHWNAVVEELILEKASEKTAEASARCVGVKTSEGLYEADWVVVCAGLGSAVITHLTAEPLALMPVLGQAMEIELPKVLGDGEAPPREDRTFQPIINGDDIQCVPLGNGRYWLGATVEFPPEGTTGERFPIDAEAEGLANLQRGAARFWPAIAQAKVLKTWSGLRPRPVGQPAPVIKPLGGTQNVVIATGHYRNGVLLAPATAQQVCQLILGDGETHSAAGGKFRVVSRE